MIRNLGRPLNSGFSPAQAGSLRPAQVPGQNAGTAGIAQSFSSYLTDAIDQISTLQSEADAASTKLVTGDLSDIHQAVIASEKAGLALQLAIEVRNKVIEAYQEVMRMQI